MSREEEIDYRMLYSEFLAAKLTSGGGSAISIAVSVEAHERLTEVLRGVNDEHRVQLLIKALS